MYIYTENIKFGGHKERKDLSTKQEKHHTIINLSHTSLGENYHIPLNDGSNNGGNSQQHFAKAVNTIRKQIQNNNAVFIHCAVGQSRSVSTLATAIAAENDQDYDSVQETLMNIRETDIEPAESLQSKGKIYLRHTTR